MKTGQIRRILGLKKREGHVITFLCTNLHYLFLTIFYTKIGTIDLGTKFDYVKKQYTFYQCFHNCSLIKLVWPAKPTLLTLTLLMRPCGRRWQNRKILIVCFLANKHYKMLGSKTAKLGF